MDPSNLPAGTPVPHVRGAGGTPGGLGTFFIGLLLVLAGAYMVLSHIQVTTAFGGMWGIPFAHGGSGFGPMLLLLMLGIGFLFVNGKSIIGWLLTGGSLALMVISVIVNLQLWFPPMSLFSTLLMFGFIAAGLGLIFRSLRTYPAR